MCLGAHYSMGVPAMRQMFIAPHIFIIYIQWKMYSILRLGLRLSIVANCYHQLRRFSFFFLSFFSYYYYYLSVSFFRKSAWKLKRLQNVILSLWSLVLRSKQWHEQKYYSLDKDENGKYQNWVCVDTIDAILPLWLHWEMKIFFASRR